MGLRKVEIAPGNLNILAETMTELNSVSFEVRQEVSQDRSIELDNVSSSRW